MQRITEILFITYMGLNDEVIAGLKYHPEVVLVAQSNHPTDRVNTVLWRTN